MPPASKAPLLAASMMPGPPPVIVAMPFFAISPPTCRAPAYIASSGAVLADPNTVITGPRR